MTTPWNSQVMADDPQLLKRGLDYLQAVGDVMTDELLTASSFSQLVSSGRW